MIYSNLLPPHGQYSTVQYIYLYTCEYVLIARSTYLLIINAQKDTHCTKEDLSLLKKGKGPPANPLPASSQACRKRAAFRLYPISREPCRSYQSRQLHLFCLFLSLSLFFWVLTLFWVLILPTFLPTPGRMKKEV